MGNGYESYQRRFTPLAATGEGRPQISLQQSRVEAARVTDGRGDYMIVERPLSDPAGYPENVTYEPSREYAIVVDGTPHGRYEVRDLAHAFVARNLSTTRPQLVTTARRAETTLHGLLDAWLPGPAQLRDQLAEMADRDGGCDVLDAPIQMFARLRQDILLAALQCQRGHRYRFRGVLLTDFDTAEIRPVPAEV